MRCLYCADSKLAFDNTKTASWSTKVFPPGWRYRGSPKTVSDGVWGRFQSREAEHANPGWWDALSGLKTLSDPTDGLHPCAIRFARPQRGAE